MNRAHRLLAAFATGIATVLLLTAMPARAPHAPLERIAPAHWDEVATFFETRLTRYSDDDVKRLTRIVLDESDRYAIHPTLIIGLIQVESSGNPRALSRVGAMGLMQLKPETAAAAARERGFEFASEASLYEPALNIRLGVHYLSKLINRFGDVDTALAAYNFGPTRIARAIRRGKSVPVRYARSVHRAYATMI
ncbi:MAG: lytic transglycosylase domain-containing protein [Myxococcota bacterium]|jgi:soluble lytic murein transglycosylase|nr:lytic transglycosylase domain-containing protein [Myxococcota bacterium]